VTLSACLPLLGIHRCFLVLYVKNSEVPIVGVRHSSARLVLDFRDDTSHPVPEATFSSCELLPAHLAEELSRGLLCLQVLAINREVIGHWLAEYSVEAVATAEALHRDLEHCLEAIFNTEALKAHSEMLEELVKRRTIELEAEVAVRKRAEFELQRALATDALTQISNRRAFQRYFDEQWHGSLDAEELALIMVDVDMFKGYNDHYGHLKGDQALREVAACLRRAVRYPEDMASRFGGEEFVVLLPRTGADGALIVAERFRDLLACAAIPHAVSPVAPHVTASVGIATMIPTSQHSPDVLLGTADHALYLAKERGRNQIVVGNVAEYGGSDSLGPRARLLSMAP
jgi:diguanylate cyclase (GGDEF)-like protein